MSSPTICAIASGIGGGIGIIRISGSDAVAIAARILSPWPAEPESHRLYYGQVLSPLLPDALSSSREVLDHGMFCLMRAPRSYTGEDVVEIHGHGGAVSLRRIVDAAICAGARAAEPGEFTRRAFLAGKIDLTRAEAVASLLSAQSVQAARQATRQLSGELGLQVGELRRQVTQLLGEMEGLLDFPDLDEDVVILRRLRERLLALANRLGALGGSFRLGGKALSTGLELALLGRTNAGKSSLVNALSESERVLVDAKPGTTRDFVEVRAEWDGIPITLIDTAGERDDKSELEAQGLKLGQKRYSGADLALVVVDGKIGLGPEEERLIAALPSTLPHLIVWNKTDQVGCLPIPGGAIGVSALNGWGLRQLRQAVLSRLAGSVTAQDELLVTSARQADALRQASLALARAEDVIASGAAVEMAASEVRIAQSRLGEITGEEVSGDVLDAIFSRFCVGK
ncbi:MAG TPA: tRNA uridine-5-carboxymethylaminomethyl(34) synthesis GTPase MnmE [Pseudomonadota bacterium]|nr:tRNA uridine-5-carboxymethylaminomethyl(34) synthesis GTPase MnmE [Pseudomonadota bacterium]